MPAADFPQAAIASEHLAATWRSHASFGAIVFSPCDCTRHCNLRTRTIRAHEWRSGARVIQPYSSLLIRETDEDRRPPPIHTPSTAVIELPVEEPAAIPIPSTFDPTHVCRSLISFG
jgi:hypothetical protein